MRQRLLISLSGAFVLGGLTVLADAPGPPGGAVPQGTRVTRLSGVFTGHWHDGTPLTQTVTMVTPDMITLQRHAYSSRPVTFRRVEPGLFRDRSGNTLRLVSPARLIWRDLTSRHAVVYDRAD